MERHRANGPLPAIGGKPMTTKKPNPLVHPPCPKCGKPMTVGGTIGLMWERCSACGHKKEWPT